jgi:hypothetical protein
VDSALGHESGRTMSIDHHEASDNSENASGISWNPTRSHQTKPDYPKSFYEDLEHRQLEINVTVGEKLNISYGEFRAELSFDSTIHPSRAIQFPCSTASNRIAMCTN